MVRETVTEVSSDRVSILCATAIDVGDVNSDSVNTYTLYEYTEFTEWRKLGKYELQNVYISPIVGRTSKSKMREA